jgi:hypothetical protein
MIWVTVGLNEDRPGKTVRSTGGQLGLSDAALPVADIRLEGIEGVQRH